MMRPALKGLKHRLYDTDGLTRLVRIKQRARGERTPLATIRSMLGGLPDALADPYNRQPMSFDEEKRELYFISPRLYGDKKVAIHL